MKKIVVNADDFGMMPEVNLGITEGIRQGVISSVSIMMNMPATGQALSYLKSHPKLDAGIHLVISQGYPLLSPGKIPTLVNRDGALYSWPVLLVRIALGLVKLDEVEAEFRAQFTHFVDELGTLPSQIDSHHHLHIFPTIFPIILRIAQQHHIRTIRCHHNRFFAWTTFYPWSWRKLVVTLMFSFLRRKMARSMIVADNFLDLDWGGPFDADKLAKLLIRFSKGLTAVACHPAKLKNPKIETNSLLFQRQRELDALLSREVKKVLATFEITDYRKLARTTMAQDLFPPAH